MFKRLGKIFSRNFLRTFFACVAGMLCLFALPLFAQAGEVVTWKEAVLSQRAPGDWIWLSSDDKYSKYFDPHTVEVVASVETPNKRIPTIIHAWTKTSYSYGGAQETIKTYNIANLIPNPNNLAYSYALVEINPQLRSLQYLQETFYNPQGGVMWSSTNGRLKEMTSQEFDELFYAAIVDEVFDAGEKDRVEAADRWLKLWSINSAGGSNYTVTADTGTMRIKGQDLIFWQWEENKDASGNVLEIKFIKKAVNLLQGTERVISGKYWNGATGWKAITDFNSEAYRTIQPGAPDFKGLLVLRTYAEEHPKWVNRYRIE